MVFRLFQFLGYVARSVQVLMVSLVFLVFSLNDILDSPKYFFFFGVFDVLA